VQPPSRSGSVLLERPTASQPPTVVASRRISTTSTRPDTRWLDVLRIVAIVGVIAIHVVGGATRFSGTGWHPAGWWAADVVNSACLWVVPVFVMASGALLLDPSRTEPAKEFYRRRLARVGPALVFWTALYLWWRVWFNHEHLTFASAGHDVATGAPYLQIYFLFVIVGLYAITPVLRRLVAHLSQRDTVLLTAGALSFSVLEYTVRDFGDAGGVNAVSRFLPFVGYYLAGHLLRQFAVPHRVARFAPAAALGGWLVTALGSAALAAHFGWNHVGFYLYDYLSPSVIVMSLGVFVTARVHGARLLGRMPMITRTRLRTAGAATFGVFLIHPLLLFPIMRALGLSDDIGHELGRLAMTAIPLAVVVGFLTGWLALLLERVPVVRRVVA
jgi:surface polysaccharide O-acyltransferase-like enzyme